MAEDAMLPSADDADREDDFAAPAAVGGGSDALGPDPANPKLPSVGRGAKYVLDQIAQAEGTDDATAGKKGFRSGYDLVFNYQRTPKPLTAMNLDEVDGLQAGMGHTPVGRYQITRGTLQGLRQELGLKGSDLFTPELQDRLGRRLMTESGYDTQGLSPGALQARFAQHWASIATANGQSVDPKQHARMTPGAFFDTISAGRKLDGEP